MTIPIIKVFDHQHDKNYLSFIPIIFTNVDSMMSQEEKNLTTLLISYDNEKEKAMWK